MATATAKKKLTSEEAKANTMAVNSSLRAIARKGKPEKVADTGAKSPADIGSPALWDIAGTGTLPGFTVRACTQAEALEKARVIDKRYHTAHFSRLCNDTDMEDNVITRMSTDVFSKEVLTEFKKRSEVIKDSIGKIDLSLEKIAFNLHWINAKQAYKADGFDTIVKYAQDTFGYQKSTCYSLISVVDRFAKRDDKGVMLEEFDDRVKGFSASKLSLMVNLTDHDIDSLKPTMSANEIRAFVKSLNAKPLPALPEVDANTGGMEDTPDSPEVGGTGKDVVDVESKDVTRQVLISCKGRKDYDSKFNKIDEFILRLLNKHPDALIEVSYTLPDTAGKKG